jgi:hypothetical protein
MTLRVEVDTDCTTNTKDRHNEQRKYIFLERDQVTAFNAVHKLVKSLKVRNVEKASDFLVHEFWDVKLFFVVVEFKHTNGRHFLAQLNQFLIPSGQKFRVFPLEFPNVLPDHRVFDPSIPFLWSNSTI